MTETDLRQQLEAVRQGLLPRRVFMQRLVGLGVPASLASLLLAGAGQAQTSPFAYKPTRRGGGGALKLLLWQGPTLLNPHFGTGIKDQEGSRPFYEPLARFDAEAQLQPVLAAEIPSRENGGVAADGRSVTWKLKRNVSWHDRQPFSADDVVFNWRYAVDPATAAVTSGVYENVKAVERVDAHTVRFAFEKPTPVYTTAAAQQLIPRHLFGAYLGAKAREAPHNLKPVGTGPYKFVDFKPGDLVRGELNPNYHGPNRPHFDTIEIKGGGDAASAARAVLQTGEYDYGWSLLVEDELLKRMEAGGKGRIVASASGTIEYLQFNLADPALEVDGERAHARTRHPVLSDIAVRRAIALLVDRAAIQEFVYGRSGVATANFLNNPALYNSPNQRIEHSVDKANALLDAAGWKRGADGVREKEGRKLKLLYQTSINALRQKVQQIVKQSCARAGIDLELKGITAAVFFSSDVANTDTYGKFYADLQMYAFFRTPDPSRLMQNLVSWEIASKANKWLGLNRGRWRNDEYDRLYKLSDDELDPAKRAALFIRMNDIACNDHAVVPLVYRPTIDAVARNLVAPLTGWDISLSGIHEWHREA